MDKTGFLQGAITRARRAVAVAAVLLLVVLGLSSVLVLRGEAQQREALASRFDTRLATAASFIEAYLVDVFQREKALSTRVFTGSVGGDEFARTAAEHGFSAAVLLDANGRLLASQPANPDLIGSDLGRKYTHLRSAVSGAPAVSGVVPSAVSGTPVIGFAVPFPSPQGQRVFSGAYAVKATPIAVFLPTATPFRSAQNLIIDDSGLIVASSETDDIGRPLSQAHPVLAGIKSTSYLGTGDQRQYVSRGLIPGTTWTLVFTVRTDELFAPLNTSSRWIPWLALAAFAATALSALAGAYPFLAQRARLVDSEARRRAILDTAGDGFVSMDQDGRISEWNTAAAALLGWNASEVLGQDLAQLIIPAPQRQAHCEAVQRFLTTGLTALPATPVRVQALHRDGTQRDVEFTLSRMRWERGWQFHAFLRDISDRIEHEAQLQTIALTDPLTGLANRRAALARLEQALARGGRHDSPVAVLYIDVNQFKTVNDTYGHAAGDAVLIGISERLRATFRTEDTMARLGGDEFLVICEDLAHPTDAQILTERTRAALAQPYSISGRVLNVTASVGLALSDSTSTAETLLNQADQQMYTAKATHKTFAEMTGPSAPHP